MKVRNGFVSNSSSSSFVISLDEITARQLDKIVHHIEEGKRCGIEWAEPSEAWGIYVSEDRVEGRTMMDNFSMRDLLKQIGVPDNVVKWDD